MKAMMAYPTRQITGRTVLFGLIAFFAIVTAVNGAFIYFAVTSWPGLSSGDAYKEGLNYNGVLEDARRQQALGWRSDFELGAEGAVTVRVLDQAGAPVNGLQIEISMARPVGEERQTILTLSQAPDGSYRGRVPVSEPGQWRVRLAARRDGETHYRMTYDAWVRP